MIAIEWIRPLAEPYLRGYRAVAQRGRDLAGYWFFSPHSQCTPARNQVTPLDGARAAAGFFVGYLARGEDFAYLAPDAPECVVFAFVHPAGGAAHKRLVREPGSLVRKTSEYIRWLTHRPPRFAFYEAELAALVRHFSMREWPRAKYEHYSRNFFIETLAWLVRSGLVRKLLGEPKAAAPRRAPRVKGSRQKGKSGLRKRRLSR